MLIIWGRKLTYRKLGYVADFCPICRAPRPFALTRIGSVGHVYYISFGAGDLVRFERECQECKTSVPTEEGVHASTSKKLLPLPELTRQTFPNLKEAWQQRLALEDQIRRAPRSLTPEQRAAQIRTPFALLSPKVEERFARLEVDKGVGIALIGALVAMGIAPSAANAIVPDQGALALLITIGLAVVAVTWQLAMARRRFLRERIVPLIAKCLRPLKPEQSELQSVLAELKQLKHKIGTKLALADLNTALAQPDGAA